MDCEEIAVNLIYSVTMIAEKTDQCGSVHIGQMFMLNEDCLRCFVGEINGFQNLIVETFGVDMKKVHVSDSMFLKNTRQKTYFDDALANERRQRPI